MLRLRLKNLCLLKKAAKAKVRRKSMNLDQKGRSEGTKFSPLPFALVAARPES
jgi:hypothetical protein